VLCVATLVAFFCTALAGAAESPQRQHDSFIKREIEQRLAKRPMLERVNVISVLRGVVTLGGTVVDHTAQAEAIALARSTPGVRRVESRIRVEPKQTRRSAAVSEYASAARAWRG
jgi:osmotically-inducible protein OsmY